MSQPSSLDLLLERMRTSDVNLVPISKTIIGKLVSYPTISKWLHTEGFPAIQIGTRWYSDDRSLTDWICANCPRLAGKVTIQTEDPGPVVIEEPQQPEPEPDYTDEFL